jgi:hypothetical protein
MGLDMYLYRREYVGGWEWKTVETDGREKALYDNIIEYLGVDRVEASPHAYVDVCVAYWRKANAVHKWFCDLDGGRDECQDIRVPREKLVELRDLCASVIQQPAMAASTLPTQPGFFFGSYDYDEWYMEDMKLTVMQLDAILASVKEDDWVDFVYRASW